MAVWIISKIIGSSKHCVTEDPRPRCLRRGRLEVVAPLSEQSVANRSNRRFSDFTVVLGEASDTSCHGNRGVRFGLDGQADPKAN